VKAMNFSREFMQRSWWCFQRYWRSPMLLHNTAARLSLGALKGWHGRRVMVRVPFHLPALFGQRRRCAAFGRGVIVGIQYAVPKYTQATAFVRLSIAFTLDVGNLYVRARSYPASSHRVMQIFVSHKDPVTSHLQ
jgi:hypothetical protein